MRVSQRPRACRELGALFARERGRIGTQQEATG
jgi:hypothetical protein